MGTGCPFAHGKYSLTAGPMGPISLTDMSLVEKILHFNREKIPPRNVHALGQGAHGTFRVTNDITKYSCADVFSSVGKETQLFCRMSGVFTEQGEADTVRDPRGMALKFYTKEGNWDVLCVNTPVFAVRDPKVGPDVIHAFKRNPRDGCWNPTQSWDFVATHPEGLHQAAMIYTDRVGTPMSYRTQHYWAIHTFSLINSNKERFWCKFHFVSQQGFLGFNLHESKTIAGEDPNFLSRDLVQSIEQGNYPKWKLMIQVMPEDEGYKNPFFFDATKVWKHDDYPLIEVGEIELNRNVVDYHAEVEQVAFSPGTIVPGIGLSPDRLLQGRLLIYDDTQTHRLGANYKQLEINRPHGVKPSHTSIGGPMHIAVEDKFPPYHPSVFGGPQPDEKAREPPMKSVGFGDIDYYPFPNEGTFEDYYEQVVDFWNTLDSQQRNNMCENIAASLEKVKEQKIIDMMMQHFASCSKEWADMVKQKLNARVQGSKKSESELMCDQFAKKLLATRGQPE